jgi:hypothetical protein
MNEQQHPNDNVLLRQLRSIPRGRALFAVAKKLKNGTALSRTDTALLKKADFTALDPYFIEISFKLLGMADGKTLQFQVTDFRFTPAGERLLKVVGLE